jgi:hypothetical protein
MLDMPKILSDYFYWMVPEWQFAYGIRIHEPSPERNVHLPDYTLELPF